MVRFGRRKPPHPSIAGQVEQILRLAQQEAEKVIADAHGEAERIIAVARQDADKLRAQPGDDL